MSWGLLGSHVLAMDERDADKRHEDRCAPGCQGIEIEPGVFSGCACPDGKLANGEPPPPGFKCDCPRHPEHDRRGLRVSVDAVISGLDENPPPPRIRIEECLIAEANVFTIRGVNLDESTASPAPEMGARLPVPGLERELHSGEPRWICMYCTAEGPGHEPPLGHVDALCLGWRRLPYLLGDWLKRWAARPVRRRVNREQWEREHPETLRGGAHDGMLWRNTP